MRSSGIARRLREIVWGGRRQRLATAVVVAAAATGTLALVVAVMQGGDGPPPSAIVLTPTATPGGPWVDLELPPLDDRYVMRAAVEDASGVALDTEFVFTAKEDIGKKDLAAQLSVEPALDFDVEDGEGDALRVVPRAALRHGQIYRFSLVSQEGQTLRNWAFQTRQPLRVVQTLPADASTNVPVDTGIELTFSHDGVSGVEPLFSIEPVVPGRFEQHKRVTVYIPGQPLQPETVYTVTLRAGAQVAGSDETMADDAAFQFETAPDTLSPPPSFIYFTRRTFEMSTTEAPVLGMYGASPGTKASFSLYRFEGAQDFMSTLRDFDRLPGWARASRDRYAVDTSVLGLVQTFEADVQTANTYGEGYARFSAPLPEGFYLVDVLYAGARGQAWLQITDLAAYFALSDDRLLLWANDLRTQGPVAGATLRLSDGTDLGVTTGPDGVAMPDTPDALVTVDATDYGFQYGDVAHDLIVQAPDGRQIIVPLGDVSYNYVGTGLRDYSFNSGNAVYWRILQTDRPLYSPTDALHFWGFVRPREGDARQFDLKAEFLVTSYDAYGGYMSHDEAMAETTVTTSATGAFSGELSFAGVPAGYHRVQISEGDRVIATVYVQVRDYVKPAYQIDVTPSRRAAIAGETVDFDVEATFFDGSPLPKATLAYNFKSEASGDLVTDLSGHARVPVVTSGEGYQAFGVAPKQAEEGEISGNAYVTVFPSALTLDAEATTEDGKATLSGTAYFVDFDRLNVADDAQAYQDSRGDVAPGQTVTVNVEEITYIQEDAGERYDFINKKVVKIYNYRESAASIGRHTLTTDSTGGFTLSWSVLIDKGYRAFVTTTDAAGRAYAATVYAYQVQQPYYYGGMYLEDEQRDQPSQTPYYYGYYGGEQGYATGEEVRLRLRAPGPDDLPSAGTNRYLFYTARNGIRDYAIEADPRYAFTFGEEHVPSISVVGVRFTGQTFQETLSVRTINFDPAEREMTIDVQPDRERYAPGEEVTLRVRTTDRDGNAVPADVNLSAVDEAIFNVDPYVEQQGDVLQSLYSAVGSGIVRTYGSHYYPSTRHGWPRGRRRRPAGLPRPGPVRERAHGRRRLGGGAVHTAGQPDVVAGHGGGCRRGIVGWPVEDNGARRAAVLRRRGDQPRLPGERPADHPAARPRDRTGRGRRRAVHGRSAHPERGGDAHERGRFRGDRRGAAGAPGGPARDHDHGEVRRARGQAGAGNPGRAVAAGADGGALRGAGGGRRTGRQRRACHDGGDQ